MVDYEPQVAKVADALVAVGFDVEVLHMRGPGSPRTQVINGVTVTTLPASLGKASKLRYILDYSWFFVLATFALARRHFRQGFSVVQIYTMPDFLVFAGVVPKLFGARIIAYMLEPTPELFDTLYGPTRMTRWMERIEQRALRFADHSITVTEELRSRYIERGATGTDISVMLNVADPGAFLAGWSAPSESRPDSFTIICHGTIEDRYGHDTIIAAAHLLRDELPDLRVVFTGKGSKVNEIERLITQYDLDDIVRFEGWVSSERLNELLTTSSVGIVAQKGSCYSHLVHTNKMYDYWLFGLPVIAGRLRATASRYDDSIIEYFDPGNASSLAGAIRHVHDDEERRRQLSENGVRALAANSWDRQRDVLFAVYGRLLNQRVGVLSDTPPEELATV